MEFSDELLLMLNMTSAADEYCKIAGSIYLAMSLCGLLNIPVIYCHFTRPNSFETTLFILISSCNLVTNISGIAKAGILFKLLLQRPNEFGIKPFYSDSLIGIPELINDGFTSLSGNLGLVPSALLALLRTIKVIRPFYHYSKYRYTAVMTMIVMYFITATILFLYVTDLKHTAWQDFTESSRRSIWLLRSTFVVSTCLMIAGNTSCLVAMAYLHYYKKKVKEDVRVNVEEMQKNDKEKKAIITIYLMKLPFCFHMVISAAYVYHLFVEKYFYPEYDLLRELYFVGTPILVAFSNPVVLLIRNTDYRNKMSNLIKSRLF